MSGSVQNIFQYIDQFLDLMKTWTQNYILQETEAFFSPKKTFDK